jgi:hypothetical protein
LDSRRRRAACHVAFAHARIDALPFAAGVGVGIMGWFFLLVKLVQRFRDRLRPQSLDRAVRGMGWAMIALGAVVMSRVAFKLSFG